MPCPLMSETVARLGEALNALNPGAIVSTSPTVFALVAAAEFGDKSQLVCMGLAARHRHWPVLLGAVAAFALLNLVAVLFGAAAARWFPEWAVAALVALLFAVFGLQALFTKDDDEDEIVEKTGHGIFVTAFSMIFLAEFGDKTQIAVAGLGAAEPPEAVWVGATLALVFTSALGVWAGRWVVGKVSHLWIHRIAGVMFLIFAALAASRAMPALVGQTEWRPHFESWFSNVKPE